MGETVRFTVSLNSELLADSTKRARKGVKHGKLVMTSMGKRLV